MWQRRPNFYERTAQTSQRRIPDLVRPHAHPATIDKSLMFFRDPPPFAILTNIANLRPTVAPPKRTLDTAFVKSKRQKTGTKDYEWQKLRADATRASSRSTSPFPPSGAQIPQSWPQTENRPAPPKNHFAIRSPSVPTEKSNPRAAFQKGRQSATTNSGRSSAHSASTYSNFKIPPTSRVASSSSLPLFTAHPPPPGPSPFRRVASVNGSTFARSTSSDRPRTMMQPPKFSTFSKQPIPEAIRRLPPVRSTPPLPTKRSPKSSAGASKAKHSAKALRRSRGSEAY